MATFLTTPRMSPELAARVEESVSGRKKRNAGRRATVIARFAALGVIVAGAVAFVVAKPSCRDDVDQERAVFLDEIRDATADITADDLVMVTRVAGWLGVHAGAYEGDLVSDELRDSAGFYAAIGRPIVYVRGPIEALANADGLVTSAEDSFRDAFVLCLVSPPDKRTEKSLLSRARMAFAGGEISGAKVERFQSALLAAPVLEPAWIEKVNEAGSQKELGALRAALKKAQLETGKRAMKSELLLALQDEPKEGDRPSELDGANPHHVRVVLVEISTGKVLLRLRKFVDPSWISEGSRVEYATGINACELALDVRAAVLPADAVRAK